MNFIERLNKIYTAQKSGDIYYKYFTRFISAPITTILSYTKITPNMATASMFFFGIFGAFLFSLGGSLNYIFGGICFIFLIVSDTVDGELARYKGTSSLFGDYLDRLAHYVTNTSLFIGIGIGLFIEFNELWIIYFSIISMICYLFDDISRDLLISCGLVSGKSRKIEKDKLSIKSGSYLRIFIYYTASNTAFFHLIVITSVFDYCNNGFFQMKFEVSHFYIFYFFLITIIKTLFRLPLIISLKNR